MPKVPVGDMPGFDPKWHLPDGSVDMDGFFKTMEDKDKEEIYLEKYFSTTEMANMCEYEQNRLKNIYRNYQMMKELGKTKLKIVLILL